MFIVKNKWVFIGISIVLLLVSAFLIGTKGLKKGIDFTGGTEAVIAYKNYTADKGEKIDLEFIKNNIIEAGFSVKDVSLQKVDGEGTNFVTIRLAGVLSPSENMAFKNAWSFGGDENYKAEQISEVIIGPSVGKELTRKAVWSISLVALIVIAFIAISFSKVSHPVASWKYGVLAVLALLHDIFIASGMYAVLGEINGAEIDSLFVLALLTIMGVSISNTIVVFDRVRENLKYRRSNEPFDEVVGKSVKQTLLRSFNTSLSTILVLLALFLFGPISIRNFSLVMITGMVVGTFSSVFVAPSLLILVESWQNKKRNRKKNKKKFKKA